MEKYLSNSEQETKQIAAKLARENKGNVFALTGELGTGKTIFVRGFAKGLGIKEKIISPTFVLIRQHPVPATQKVLYHMDLYRLDQIDHLGLGEIWSDPNNIVLIEWAEKAKNILPKKTTWIDIKKDANEHLPAASSGVSLKGQVLSPVHPRNKLRGILRQNKRIITIY